MRFVVVSLFVCLVLAGCVVSEEASFSVVTCPNCSAAYSGFSTCAFFNAANASAQTLIDADNYVGEGVPIYMRGYMHHKFCFNETHVAFGSANPTVTGLTKNNNLVVRARSEVLASNFASEYAYLLGRGGGSYTQEWVVNGREAAQLFCPRSSCEEYLLEVLLEAEDSVLFLAFSFTSQPVAQALVELQEAGVCVAGVIESCGARSRWGRFEQLEAAGVSVVLADTPGLMHHKAFLVDGELAVVGSYNPSASANERNAETLVFLREPVVVQAVLEEFLRVGGVAGCR